MKHLLLFFLSIFLLNINAQNVVSHSKSFSLSKKEIKGNEISFQIENISNQPFVAFDIKVNGQLNKNANIYILKNTSVPSLSFRSRSIHTQSYRNEIEEFQTLKRDMHFQNKDSWSSELQFFSTNTKFITIKIENAGNKIENINFNFFYPNKTENLEAIEAETEGAPKSINCNCPIPAYEARADWDPAGTHPAQTNPTYTTVTHLIVHHAAGPNTSSDWAAMVRSIWNYHVNSNGWSDIGYNYLIDPNGVIYEGRGDNVLGAHAAGFNTNSMGICLLGNYEPNTSEDIDPSNASINSLVELLSWKECDISADPLSSSIHSPTSNVEMHIEGHRSVGTTSTSCPGDNVYDILPNIRNACSAYIPNCAFASNPDLVVSSLATNPSTVTIGENTTINLAVGNGGNTDVIESLDVELKIDGNLVNTFVIDSIHSGQILNFSEPNHVFSSLGAHQVCVYIDAASNEANTANNSYCKTIEVEDSVIFNSDLVAQSIDKDIVNPMVLEEINFSFDFANMGTLSTSEAVYAKIKIDGMVKQIFSIPVATVNQSFVKTFAYTFNQIGNHELCLEINSPTNEVSTQNNTLCKTLYISQSSVSVFQLNQNILSFDVYPNPANENFLVDLSFKQKEEVKITLMNALGQRVYEKQFSPITIIKENINVKNLSKGIYVLRIETQKGSTSRKVFVQ